MSTSLFSAALSTWRAVHGATGGRKAAQDFASAIVKLSIKTVAGARTAENLGSEREGTGVVIDASGVILTIGYLILESESILVVTGDGRVFPAHVIGFDHATGFGLLRAAPGVAERPLELGDSDAVRELNTVRVAAHPAADGVSNACVVARRRFTGWWEYMLDEAIFTAPPRYDHSGAALVDESGKLVGIASLWVSDALELGVAFPGNMFVPINLLKPLYDDLVTTGRRRAPLRPWLGLYSEEVDGHVVVTRVLPGAPADEAGLQRGDVILGVGTHAIGGQAEFYGHLWERDAGADVMLHILRKRSVQRLLVRTGDRLEYLRPWRI